MLDVKNSRMSRYFHLSIIISAVVVLGIMFFPAAPLPSAQDDNPYLAATFLDDQGRQVAQVAFPGKPPDVLVKSAVNPQPNSLAGVSVIAEVPAFSWSYGCSPTSAAMLFGYYDRTGYSNMYDGPAGDGLCPLDNTIWGETVYPDGAVAECPLSATHEGVDGRATNGHVDDYWIDYLEPGPDPFEGNWAEHDLGECTADFMGTNQAKYDNVDGSTWFFWLTSGDPLYDYTGSEPETRDGCHGMRLFAESRGYTVAENYTQLILGNGTDPAKGFSFDDFMAEIDAGRLVLIHVTGHTMLGLGYDSATQAVYIHDTWDHSVHQMTWGSSYYGMAHQAVSVIALEEPAPPAISTGQANQINSFQAVLNGSLEATGTASSVDVYFEWGQTQSGPYPNQTAAAQLDAAGPFSVLLTGLAPETTCYFRAAAAGDGTVHGVEQSFTTLADGPPTMEPLIEPEGSYYRTAPVFSGLGFNDDYGLDDGWYQVDGFEGAWTALFADAEGLSWDSADWVLPGFDELAEGSHVLYFSASDDEGQVSGAAGEWNWQFYKDVTPPPGPAGLTSPSHQPGEWSADSTIEIAWTDGVDNLSGLDGYSVLWDATPDTVPDQVKDIQEAVETLTSPELADGDSHYFHIAGVDTAGNWAAALHLGPFYIDTSVSQTQVSVTAPNSVSPEETISISALINRLPGVTPVTFAGIPVTFNYVFHKLESATVEYGSATVDTNENGLAVLNLPAPGESATVVIDAVFNGNDNLLPSSSMKIVAVVPFIETRITASSSAGEITFYLTDQYGNPLSGHLLSFLTTGGSLSAATAATDENGEAVVTLSETTGAVVSASFGGYVNPSGWSYQPAQARVTVML